MRAHHRSNQHLSHRQEERKKVSVEHSNSWNWTFSLDSAHSVFITYARNHLFFFGLQQHPKPTERRFDWPSWLCSSTRVKWRQSKDLICSFCQVDGCQHGILTVVICFSLTLTIFSNYYKMFLVNLLWYMYTLRLYHTTTSSSTLGFLAYPAFLWCSLMEIPESTSGCWGRNWHLICGKLSTSIRHFWSLHEYIYYYAGVLFSNTVHQS